MKKCEQELFTSTISDLDLKIAALASNYNNQVNRMLTNENYIEKYLPVYIQRMINENIECVTSKDNKKKQHHYMELKMPTLIQPIIEDSGEPNLIEMQKQFHDLFISG